MNAGTNENFVGGKIINARSLSKTQLNLNIIGPFAGFSLQCYE